MDNPEEEHEAARIAIAPVAIRVVVGIAAGHVQLLRRGYI